MSAATILTLSSGRGIDLLHPKASDVDWESYAEHLAKEARYNGATPDQVYSVAEHQCRGADAIIKVTGDTLLAAYFLVHDQPEAVLKDDTTPKKNAIAEICQQEFGILGTHVLAAYKSLEYRHEVAVHQAAGLTCPPHSGLQAAIKRWDLIMFVTEWRDLMKNVPHPDWQAYSAIEPLIEPIVPWDWQTAKRGLLRRCMELLPALKVKA
jgi:hypothetical protein